MMRILRQAATASSTQNIGLGGAAGKVRLADVHVDTGRENRRGPNPEPAGSVGSEPAFIYTVCPPGPTIMAAL
jgi:hypothetical protein